MNLKTGSGYIYIFKTYHHTENEVARSMPLKTGSGYIYIYIFKTYHHTENEVARSSRSKVIA